MHAIMLSIYIFGIILCFYSVYIIVARKNTEKASFMVVVIVCSIMNLLGYLFELTSTELSAIMVAIKFQYLGKAFSGTFLLLTFGRYYKWGLPNKLMYMFWGIDIIMYIIICTADMHTFFYTSIDTITVDGNVFIVVGKSPLYLAFMAYMLSQILLFAWLCYRQEKRDLGRERVVAVTLVTASIVACFMVVASLTINKTNYDFVPIIMALLTVTISILIKKYGLFTTMDMAKENLITNINEGVIVKDALGNFSYANPMAHEIFPELSTIEKHNIGKIVEPLLTSADEEVCVNDMYYQVQSSDLFEGKTFAGQIITLFDVTKLHEDAKNMERLKDEADNANQAKSKFLMNMSHEIRTPINAVLGMDEMILRECSDPTIIEYANNIKSAGETLLGLVNDVLDLAKIESGKMHLIEVDYRIKDVIKSIINTMSLKMSEKGLSFLVEIDKEIPSVLHGDEMRLKQIIMNLLSNAYKYTREGYVKLILTGEKNNGCCKLRVDVVDSGIGIRDEDLSKLFESFERMDEKKNRTIEGTGLGLSITNNLLNMMGSRLMVDSVYRQGSTFYFELEQKIIDEYPIGDINKADRKVNSQSEMEKTFTAPNAKVLVVDDNSINLAVMKGLLKKTRMQVETALSGMDCLEMIKSTQYDIIFMDHLMPEMDGVETLTKIRNFKLHKNVDTPIIVLTANAVSGAREKYLEYGFSDYLTKPVDVKMLEESIIRFLPKEKIEN